MANQEMFTGYTNDPFCWKNKNALELNLCCWNGFFFSLFLNLQWNVKKVSIWDILHLINNILTVLLWKPTQNNAEIQENYVNIILS